MNDKLNHYLQAWNLTSPRLLTTTFTSHVYTVTAGDDVAVLKLLTPAGEADERGGAVALRHFDGRGAVHLLRGDDGAHLLEYAGGDDLTGMVRRGDDEAAARIIADVLRTLHSVPAGDAIIPGLTSLRTRFRSLFAKAAGDADSDPGSIYIRAAQVAEIVLANQRNERVLHGDIHHENIRYSAARGWLALDPKGLYGEPTYDAANTLCNPPNMPELVRDEARMLRIAGILAEALRVSRSRMLTYVFIHACLSAAWSLEDGQDTSQALIVASLAEPHIDPAQFT